MGNNNSNVTPINKEANWDKSKTIISRTDKYGTIVSVNKAFVETSGYTEKELVSKSHNIIRHPDMPKCIFKILWNNLKNGENFFGIVKNLTKNGEYYWVLTDFDIIKDKNGVIVNYEAKRIAIPQEIITIEIEPLYGRIAKLEAFYGENGGENYLNGFLEKENKSYVEYIRFLIDKYGVVNDYTEVSLNNEEDNRGFLRKLFSKTNKN
ncbi:PAS domain-containing protein [Flavobacterium psychrophilum]|nr:PAS domain-containing protein [Flavobacterium psychrophilum]